MSKKSIILLVVILMTAYSSSASSIRLSLSGQRGKTNIEVGDLFYVTIDVTDLTAQVKAPELKGAKLAYFSQTGESLESSTVNGVTTRHTSTQWTATYRAVTPGNYTAGPVSAGNVKSNYVSYSIVASKGDSSDRSNGAANSDVKNNSSDNKEDDGKPRFIGKGDNNLFLKATVSSSSVYEQQALVYTLKIYTTYDGLNFLGATQSPKFDGFVVEQSNDISTSWSFENYNGKTYKSAVVARYIIFPQMTGSLKVIGNTYTVSVSQREYYHDPFWGNLSYSTPLQLNVTPNDLVVNVKSLPEPKPADFSGGVGNFSISSDLKSKEFKTNQAASIVYTVKGTGNIKYVQLPELSALVPPEIEVYTPTSTQDVHLTSDNTSGTVTFDYSFMPLEEGTFQLPDLKLVYFNPATGKYETSVAKGYEIHVGKGNAPDKNRPKALRFEPDLQNVDMKVLSKVHTPLVYEFSYWLFYIIPFLVVSLAFVFYRRYISLHADMASFNSRMANKFARKRLKKAENAMRKNDSDNFYHEILLALWGYLSDKLKMPTSELMRDNIRQVLTEKAMPADVIDSLIQTVDKCEFAKYSSAGGEDSMNHTYDEAADIINRLEKEFKK